MTDLHCETNSTDLVVMTFNIPGITYVWAQVLRLARTEWTTLTATFDLCLDQNPCWTDQRRDRGRQWINFFEMRSFDQISN